jgi:hypothetical protein
MMVRQRTCSFYSDLIHVLEFSYQHGLWQEDGDAYVSLSEELRDRLDEYVKVEYPRCENCGYACPHNKR